MKFKATHWMSATKTYTSWRAMLRRCNDKKYDYYYRYGGRWITYDEKWETFEWFYEDMWERPEWKTLDRIDNDGNYSKENCRWVTGKRQARNKSNNRLLTYNWKTMCLAEWCEELWVSRLEF